MPSGITQHPAAVADENGGIQLQIAIQEQKETHESEWGSLQ